MQLRHATPKNLLQKFSKSISFLMNGNSLQNLLRSIDIAQSFCLRKQKVLFHYSYSVNENQNGVSSVHDDETLKNTD